MERNHRKQDVVLPHIRWAEVGALRMGSRENPGVPREHHRLGQCSEVFFIHNTNQMSDKSRAWRLLHSFRRIRGYLPYARWRKYGVADVQIYLRVVDHIGDRCDHDTYSQKIGWVRRYLAWTCRIRFRIFHNSGLHGLLLMWSIKNSDHVPDLWVCCLPTGLARQRYRRHLRRLPKIWTRIKGSVRHLHRLNE